MLRLARWLLLALLLLLPLGGAGYLGAQEPIVVTSDFAVNEFPQGVRFIVAVSSSRPITVIDLRFFIGSGRVIRVAKPELLPREQDIRGEYLLRLAGNDYQPPGAVITYWYTIRDEAGNVLETPRKSYAYLDKRFPWQEINDGLLTALYYGPAKPLAEEALRVAELTNQRMASVLGVQLSRPLRIIIYNSVSDMVGALPPVSELIRRTLVTEGQAYGEQGLMFVLGDDPQFRGVASHEFTHILVHEATAPNDGLVPVWLNEGLAEYGNIQPGVSYDAALQQALRTNSLLTIPQLTGRLGLPEQVILLYGQSRSIVRFMIDTYGPEEMAELMKAIKAGNNVNSALQQVYGFDIRGLEERWRQAIGAPPAPEDSQGPLLFPTAAPVPTVAPIGADIQPQAETPTPAPTVVVTPTPEPPRREGGGGCGAGSAADAFFPALGAVWLLGVFRVVRRPRHG